MVLGSIVPGMTYPKSMYLSAKAYGFGYLPHSLMIEPGAWEDEANLWLAGLYGLTYERILPAEGLGPDKAWEDYLNRIWRSLKEGSAVQITRGWMGSREEGGRVQSATGYRMFWWEGIDKPNRPDMHYFTAVGLDRSGGVLYMNDPIFGWFGQGKEMELKLSLLRPAVEKLLIQHRYITITFKRGRGPAKTEAEIETLLKERIRKKIAGDPSAYDSPAMWQEFYRLAKAREFAHGLKAIRAFREDLQPKLFGRILAAKRDRTKIQPAGTVSWLDLGVYHQAYMALVSAEYLEEEGRLKDWEWIQQLAIHYFQLWLATSKLRALFKAEPDLDRALAQSGGILQEMDRGLARIEEHFQNGLR